MPRDWKAMWQRQKQRKNGESAHEMRYTKCKREERTDRMCKKKRQQQFGNSNDNDDDGDVGFTVYVCLSAIRRCC